MNVILGIMALLSICVESQAQSSDAQFQERMKSILPKINAWRLEFIQQAGLPDPPELKWNESVVAEVQGLEKDCSKRYKDKIWMFGEDENYNKLFSVNIGISEKLKVKETVNIVFNEYFGVKLLNTVQTSIGCAENPCTLAVDDDMKKEGISGDSIKIPFVCMVQPRIEWSGEGGMAYIDKRDLMIEQAKKVKLIFEEKEASEDDQEPKTEESEKPQGRPSESTQAPTKSTMTGSPLCAGGFVAFLMILVFNSLFCELVGFCE